jgi:SAM-dependent methyltransferase
MALQPLEGYETKNKQPIAAKINFYFLVLFFYIKCINIERPIFRSIYGNVLILTFSLEEPMTVMTPIDRQKPNQRSEYSVYGYTEHFAVPLIKRSIENALKNDLQPSHANAKVLDAGCGRQPCRQILEAAGYTYTALDAQQNLDGTVDVVLPVDHKYVLQALTPASFDLIFCTEVMEHVAEWDQAFSNFSQLLTPGGKLFITCPHFYNLHEEPYDFWRPTTYALKYFGEKHGLDSIYVQQSGDAWDVLGTLLGSFPIRSKNQSPYTKMIHFVVASTRRIVFWLLLKGFIQKHLRVEGSIYHSNVAVFKKG